MVIKAATGEIELNLPELWRRRELIYFLAWREVKVRYKQTALGAAWAILQPLLGTAVFTVFFGRLAQIPSDGLPYSVFCLTALVPWTFFANGISQCSNSLVGNAELLTKVYFPRLAIPIASVIAAGVDLLFSLGLLLLFVLSYRILPNWHILWLPYFIGLAFVTALGVGMWLAVLYLHYRDIRFVLPFLTQIWMLATPIAYPSSLLGEPWRSVYGLNPMVGVVEGFRWSLLSSSAPPVQTVFISSVVAVLVLVSGLVYFRKMEETFADIV